MELQGRILGGRYRLGSLLGVGGMAAVYLANDRVLERQVAVKVLSPPYAQDPLFVERFRREARTAARLSHPNIVAVFDSGSDAGQHYLVMEYVAGHSLAELLHRQGRLAPGRAAELTIQVCAALAAAHAQGLGRCCVWSTRGMLRSLQRSGVKSPRRARRTRPPTAGSPAPRRRARSALAAGSGRRRARRSRPWRYGPA